MNQSQINEFLTCLGKIDDLNYLLLHDQDLKHVDDGHEFNLKHTKEHDHDHEHDHEHHEHESSNSNDLLVAKTTAMVVLFFASTLCGSIPFILNRYFKWTEDDSSNHNRNTTRSAIIIKSLLYFGGGVLMATTFLHLLPEVQEVIEVLQQCNKVDRFNFPLAEFLMCMGFYLMYLLEESIHTYIHRQNKRLTFNDDNSAVAAFRRGQSVRGSYLLRGSNRKDGNNDNSTTTSNTNVSSLVTLSVDDLVHTPKISEERFNAYDNHHHHTQQQQQQHNHHNHHSHFHQHEDHQVTCQDQNHGYGHSHLATTLQPSAEGDNDILASSLRGLFIVLALSVHELFEGMAIGLEGSASSIWFLFGAVSAHKLVLAFCVGVELIVARTRLTLSIIYVLTFAVVSPLGIGIGILVSHNSSGSPTEPTIASALLQGLSCGTLLYVVFFEILSKQHNGLVAYCALLIGFACMFGLQQLGAGGHGHSHGSCGELESNNNTPLEHIHHENSHDHHNHDLIKQNAAGRSFEEQLKILRNLSQHTVKN